MSESLWHLFGFLGMLTAVGAVFIIAYATYNWLSDWIDDLRWEYKYKHRFDKPPTAKCYCKDCRLHDKKDQRTNRCHLPDVDRFTPDNGFCYMAEPMTRKESERNAEQ